MIIPQKIKDRITVWSIYSTPRNILKWLKAGTQTDTSAPKFMIAKMQKKPRSPSTDECITKVRYTQATELYSASIQMGDKKMDEPWKRCANWNKVQGKYCMSPLTRVRQIHRWLFNGYSLCLWWWKSSGN